MDHDVYVSSGVDLSSYPDRIDYSGTLEPTFEVLESLHFAHATHIPFENLDLLLKRPIRLDIESLQDKMVKNMISNPPDLVERMRYLDLKKNGHKIIPFYQMTYISRLFFRS
ncbi:MAG TPA: arylamine N-acetyltransferase [Balneolales bacterium]|nr:arylamine N-acetyltransferase [Balneolales bacterium]